jgi:catechol 2,3-dioxygenase-like lactoylglutathione lyase family enzyme
VSFLYDHIDLRVPDLGAAETFYRKLLPALGFKHRMPVDGWLQFTSGDGKEIAPFFGITEDPNHQPNTNRIAFRAESAEEVDGLAAFARGLGARKIEGPGYEDEGEGTYYAVFFEDPWGNRLEICYRDKEKRWSSASA